MPKTAKKSAKAAQPKVSVVVPIYNVEKYLRQCVDSILAQTLKDIEVILVDDGSPDNCGQIVDEYAKKDPRVVPVHQENGGYSKAVNHGIDLARGEYIGIIESDDFIEPDMYESLYNDAKKYDTDVTKGGFYYYNPTLREEDQNVVWRNPRHIDLAYAPEGAFHITEWPRLVGFHASIWSSIYRAEFVKAIKIPETAGASYQDFPFMIDVMTRAKRISVVKKPFVHWRNEPAQGNSTSAKGKKLLLMAKNTETGLKILQQSGYYEQLKEPFFAHALWTNIGFFYRISSQYRHEYFEYLRRIFAPLSQDGNFYYIYFTQNDIANIKRFLSGDSYAVFQLKRILKGGSKRFMSIFPTYRNVKFLRDKLIEFEEQGYFDAMKANSEDGMLEHHQNEK